MNELKKEELMEVKGGTNFISGSFITSLVRAGDTLLELGRSLGTSIRRIFDGNICRY